MKKALSIISKIVKVIATIFVALIVLVVLIQRIFNNSLSLGGFRLYTVVTGSMEPTYKVKDIIISKSRKPEDIKVGDPVVYLGKESDFENKIVTHRVIEKREESGKYYFVTKGDNNTGIDPEIEGSQIYGVVIHKSAVLSFVSKLVTSNVGFFLLIIVPGALLIVLEIADRVKGEDSEESDGSDKSEK